MMMMMMSGGIMLWNGSPLNSCYLIAQDARSDLRILRNNQASSSKWKKVGDWHISDDFEWFLKFEFFFHNLIWEKKCNFLVSDYSEMDLLDIYLLIFKDQILVLDFINRYRRKNPEYYNTELLQDLHKFFGTRDLSEKNLRPKVFNLQSWSMIITFNIQKSKPFHH